MMEPEFHKDEMTVTPLLVELPNGDWVRADRITAINIFRKMDGLTLKDRVVVTTKDTQSSIPFDTIEECRVFAHSLGVSLTQYRMVKPKESIS